MNLSDFDFVLPASFIAQRPSADRGSSRMLLLARDSGAWQDAAFRDLPPLLHGDELIVFNNARVIPARLFGHRRGLRSQPPGEDSHARREHLSAEIEVLLTRH